MSQILDAGLSKRARRRGKWKENWIRKNSGNLAKKQKLTDDPVDANAVTVKDASALPIVVGLPSNSNDKVVLAPQPMRKAPNPVYLWSKTYENLLKWQTTHQLNYWKNTSQKLSRVNRQLKEDISALRTQINLEQPNEETHDGDSDEVILLEAEDEKVAEENENKIAEPDAHDKRVIVIS